MSEDKSSKTEQASQHKLKQSREQGQVARSADLSSTLSLLMGVLCVALLAGFALEQLKVVFEYCFVNVDFHEPSSEGYFRIIIFVFTNFLFVVGPILLVNWLTGFVVTASQVGLHISFKPLEPNFSKLNPVEGAKRLFSLRSLVTTGIASAKMILCALVGLSIIYGSPKIQKLLLGNDSNLSLALSGNLSLDLTLRIVTILVVLAILDYVYQKWQFSEDMKMTKEEVKKEHKEQDGDQHIKGKIKAIGRSFTQKKSMKAAVTDADVIVTNPIHIAVALKYDRLNPHMAPVVVAKGSRLLAERIKGFARDADIEIIVNIPLARSLFKNCNVDQEISEDLYIAVAEVLAMVFKKKNQQLF